MTKKEIFVVVEKLGVSKPMVFQYSDMGMFDHMLANFRKWEKQGKVAILDVRDAIYN